LSEFGTKIRRRKGAEEEKAKMKIDAETIDIMSNDTDRKSEREKKLQEKYGSGEYGMTETDHYTFNNSDDEKNKYFLKWLTKTIIEKYELKKKRWAGEYFQIGDFYTVESKKSYIFVKVLEWGILIYWFSKRDFEYDKDDLNFYKDLKEVV
jgi:hypothetical protein